MWEGGEDEGGDSVYLDIFPSQHLLCPFTALVCDPVGFAVVSGDEQSAVGGRGDVQADEVGEDGVEVVEAVVHGDEVAPGEQARVMPLAEDGGLDPERLAPQERAPPAGERVAVHVDEILGFELA